MSDDFSERPTDLVGEQPTVRSESRARFERRVAAAVVLNGFSVSYVAAKFGLTAEQVREIYGRRATKTASDGQSMSR